MTLRPLLLAALCTFPLFAQSLTEQAAAAWAKRDQAGQTEQAIRLWEEAVKADPKNSSHWIRLTKAMDRAERHSSSIQEKRLWADKARAAAEEAIKLSPNSSDANTVYGEALGQWAQARKGVRSLGAVKKAVVALEKAVEINPRNAYAHMLLAEFYRQSPGVVSVGDKKKGMGHARLAVQFGPEYAINHLVLARAYLELGKKDDATRELHKILTLAPPKDTVPETRADQETAKKMLQELTCGEGQGSACMETQ